MGHEFFCQIIRSVREFVDFKNFSYRENFSYMVKTLDRDTEIININFNKRTVILYVHLYSFTFFLITTKT